MNDMINAVAFIGTVCTRFRRSTISAVIGAALRRIRRSVGDVNKFLRPRRTRLGGGALRRKPGGWDNDYRWYWEKIFYISIFLPQAIGEELPSGESRDGAAAEERSVAGWTATTAPVLMKGTKSGLPR